jgi:uncharacterized membrane protein
MNCPKCKKQINENINFCPYCQVKINEQTAFTPTKQIIHSNQLSNTQKMILLAILTAMVVVLQIMAVMLKPMFPVFTISTVFIPITIGAALCGIYAGAWLGLVFGIAVLISGDAAGFLVINAGGTIATVLVKGVLAGLAAACAYKIFAEKNKTLAAVIAAVVCPIVNTGIFVVGCYLFFLPTITAWGEAAGFANAIMFIFFGMIGINFLVEMALNMFFCPVITRLIKYGQKSAV